MQQFLRSNICHYGSVLWPQLYFLCIDEKLSAQWTSVTDMTLIRSGKTKQNNKKNLKTGLQSSLQIYSYGQAFGIFPVGFWDRLLCYDSWSAWTESARFSTYTTFLCMRSTNRPTLSKFLPAFSIITCAVNSTWAKNQPLIAEYMKLLVGL